MHKTYYPPNTLSLAITSAMMETAMKFASELQTYEKRTQVFHNTLAVQVVHSYMTMLGNSPELELSDSWNPLLRQFSDTADLKLGEAGHVECRPVDPNTLGCRLPEDLPRNRVGVIPVKIDCMGYQAQLLGFTPKVMPGAEIPPAQLQPLDVLIGYLESSASSQFVQLRQWLEGKLDMGWQAAESLIGHRRYILSRGVINASCERPAPTTGAKRIDLGKTLDRQAVVLLLRLSPLAEDNLEIRVQLHPCQEDQYLPNNLQLELMSDSGESLRAVTTRNFDNLIQLPRFQCHPGEQFGIQISKDNIEIREVFMI